MDADHALEPEEARLMAGDDAVIGADAADDAPAPGEMPPNAEAPLGLEAARLDMSEPTRVVGHCLWCDEFVERDENGLCAAGHDPRYIAGAVEVAEGEDVPRLPGFNLAAFLLPPLWGLWYGQLVGIFFVPLWTFANNAFEIARGKGGVWLGITVLIMLANVFFMFIFARRANAMAYHRVCAKQSVETFKRRQAIWGVFAVATWVAFGAWWFAFESGMRF